jgi:hypothetical protein
MRAHSAGVLDGTGRKAQQVHGAIGPHREQALTGPGDHQVIGRLGLGRQIETAPDVEHRDHCALKLKTPSMIAGALGSGTEVTARSTSATSDEGMP